MILSKRVTLTSINTNFVLAAPLVNNQMPNLPAAWVNIQADPNNSNPVRIIDSAMTATAASGGYELQPGGTMMLPFMGGPGTYNLNQIAVWQPVGAGTDNVLILWGKP